MTARKEQKHRPRSLDSIALGAASHAARRDLSSRVIRDLYLPVLAAPGREDLRERVARLLACDFVLFTPRVQAECARAIEAWALSSGHPLEAASEPLYSPRSWRALHGHLRDPALQLAFEKAAARHDLEDYRDHIYRSAQPGSLA